MREGIVTLSVFFAFKNFLVSSFSESMMLSPFSDSPWCSLRQVLRSEINYGSRGDLKKTFDSNTFVVHLLITNTKKNKSKQANGLKNPILLRMSRKGIVPLFLLIIIQIRISGEQGPGTSTQIRNSFPRKEPNS